MKTDLFIAGAGPAGLCAAQYGARAGLAVLAAEELAIGGQALLIDNLENYPGNIPTPNKGPKSGYELIEALKTQALEFGAKFISDSVETVEKLPDGSFNISLGKHESLRSGAVVLATGTRHKFLDIPGEKEFYGRGVSYCAACDGPFFRGKKIFVVGGGDVAVAEALYLSRLSDKVILLHRRDKLRAQKALANRLLNNANITVLFNKRLVEIRGKAKLGSVLIEDTLNHESTEQAGDAVFIFVGSSPRVPTIKGGKLDLSTDGYVLTGQDMQTNIPGLFAVGDCRASPFRQVVAACGDGAIAAHCAAAYLHL
jgi:thioredoxin reductase (NADPH)